MSVPRKTVSAFSRSTKPVGILGAAGLVFGAGLICGGLIRWVGAADIYVSTTVGEREAPVLRMSSASPQEPAKSANYAGRLRALASTRDPHQRKRAIAAIGDGLGARELRAAIADLERRSVRDSEEIRLALLARWAELEPESALRYAMKLPPGFDAPGAIEAVVKNWAAVDLKAAEEGVASLPANFMKKIARGALLSAISESDPPRALAKLRETTAFGGDVDTLFNNWATKNPAEAAASAAQLPADWQRKTALTDVLRKWAEVDREAALTWAQSFRPPVSAGVTIEASDPTPLAAVLQTWMIEDSNGAIGWLEQLPASAAKSDLLAMLSNSLSDGEPQHAVEVAAMMPAGEAQDTALGNLIRQWSENDFAGALAWAQQQPDEHVRQVLLPELVNTLRWRDTGGALELALSLGGKAGTEAVADVLLIWAHQDPAAAAEWVGAQPENAAYAASVASAWAQKDRDRALEWVKTIPPGLARDEALARGALKIEESQAPQAAEAWIVGIANEEKRTEALDQLAYQWSRTNPYMAREWIKTAPLSSKVKADLLAASVK